MTLLDNARELRSHQTDAEQKLWQQLRAHRFMGLKFKRQKPIGRYIVDFVCMELRVVIELDGGQHLENPADKERDAWLAAEGYRVLRFWNNQVLQEMDGVLEDIRQAALSPSPSPANRGGEQSTPPCREQEEKHPLARLRERGRGEGSSKQGEGAMLPFSDFLQVVRDAPLVSIDLIVENEAGQYLLGLRLNQPAKGDWFVPGGRICKNETLDDAFARIARAELGIDLARSQSQWLGLYEHFYETNAGAEPGFGTHYVVLAHKIRLDSTTLHLPKDEQHGRWRWFGLEEIINQATVNRHARDYFVANSKSI